MAKLLIVVAALVLAVTLQQADALKCWRCSTDSSSSAYCDDPFDPSLIQNEQQRRWAYVDCSVPQLPFSNSPPQKAVCKKVKQILNDREVISRSCVVEDFNSNSCSTESYVSYAKIEFCETCGTDGCNGAGQFAPITALIISAVVAKIILL